MNDEVNYGKYISSVVKLLDETCEFTVVYNHHGRASGIHPTTMTICKATQTDDAFLRLTFPNSPFLQPTIESGWGSQLDSRNFVVTNSINARYGFAANIAIVKDWLSNVN